MCVLSQPTSHDPEHCKHSSDEEEQLLRFSWPHMRLKKVQHQCIMASIVGGKGRNLREVVRLFQSERVYLESFDVAERLYKLELHQDILWEAIREGHSLAQNMTENDPPASRGIAVWGKVMRRMREILIPMGWVRSDQQRYSTTVHRSGIWSVAVSAGDWRTGLPDYTPATSAEKGSSMKDAIKTNQTEFSQIDPAWAEISRKGRVSATWVLLYFINKITGDVRAELSLPIELSDGHITGWAKRIILTPPADLSGVGPAVLPLDEDSEGEDIDVPVGVRQ